MVPLPAFLVGSLKGLSFPRALFPLISMLWLLAEVRGGEREKKNNSDNKNDEDDYDDDKLVPSHRSSR